MKTLLTKSKLDFWDRTVYLYVNEIDDLTTNINDKCTCKLIHIMHGTGVAKIDDKSIVIISPMIICLTPNNKFEMINDKNIKASILYFRPVVINDNLTYDKLSSGYFNNMSGSTIYQDFSLLKTFYYVDKPITQIIKISPSNSIAIETLIKKINNELSLQSDGFWPCRSRSYFIELLFYINYSINKNSNDDFFENEESEIQPIISYLHENIANKITLEDLSKKFMMNRNKLNNLFYNYTKLTCMQYHNKMRMDLATLLLSDTDLPIVEISERVGFLDTNYFIKTFKKHNNITPAQFRKKIKNIGL